MTAREFKDRLAAGDKLVVVMMALFELEGAARCRNQIIPKCLREGYQHDAAHILAALASAEVKRT